MLATLISLPSTSLSFSDSFCHLLSLSFLHFTQRLLSLFTSLTFSVTGVTQLLKCVKEMAFWMSLKSDTCCGNRRCVHYSPWLHIQYCPFSITGCTFTHLSTLSWLFWDLSKGLSCFSLCVEQRVIAGKRTLHVYESPFSKFPMWRHGMFASLFM